MQMQMQMQLNPPPRVHQFAKIVAALQRDFPKADIVRVEIGVLGIRTVAARASDVAVGDKATARVQRAPSSRPDVQLQAATPLNPKHFFATAARTNNARAKQALLRDEKTSDK